MVKRKTVGAASKDTIEEQNLASEKQTFLANLSKELSKSLDYHEMLKNITSLAIPIFADWCSVDLYDEGKGFEQVSISHANPKKVSEAKKYRELNPLEIDQPTGIPNILRTGKSEYYPLISDELLEHYIDDAETLEYMKSFNLHSIIIAPIRIKGIVRGGISFITSDSQRYYSQDDLVLAEEIASRISLAITNSKLYSEVQNDLKNRHKLQKELLIEKQKLESRVKERTEQLQLTNHGLREEIVKRQAVEKELKINTEELALLNRSKDEFISIASHQLRTPATGVKQYVGMLLEGFAGTLTKQQETLLEKAYDSNERQLDIVSDLLRVAQVDAGKVMLRKASVPLCILVEDIVREQQAIANAKHQIITYKPVKPDVDVFIDTASIRMVLENLLDNASKYSHDKSHIEVSVGNDKKCVKIIVSDDGVGIDPGGVGRLFEKFSRIDNPLSTTVGGSGLGLYWARKIVELHGGTLKYKPNIPKGTTFVVKLPKTANL